MSDELAHLVADFYRRRALGEEPAAADYLERAGDRFDEFEQLLRVGAEADQERDSFEPRALPLRLGPYLLLRELGRGAVGVVYEAIHRKLGRTVALKVLRTGFDTHPTALERFRREARACAQIRHDHIVKVYEAGDHKGRPFCAMELVDGHTLFELRREGRLPPLDTLAEGLAGIAEALHVLHEGGIVHRDVKPSNIMVAKDGRMLLADFGLARTVASVDLTRTGEALGTPIYMSPEQLLADRRRIDGRTDVYCLGATLYEMLTGGPVFKARNPGEMMRQILSDVPEPPSARDPRVPAALDAIALRALAKRRRDRYPDAAALAADLRRFARGEAVRPPPRRARRSARRRLPRWPLGVAGAAVLALAVFLWPDPVASVTVRAFPASQAFLDGEAAGATPLASVVKAGSRELRLVCDGFEPVKTTLDLASGETYSGTFVLRPNDETDPAAVARMARAFGLDLTRLDPEPPPTERSGFARPYAFLPRGDVDLAELDQVKIEFGEFLGDGRLVFVVDGETVHDEPYNDWSNTHWRDRMPEAVRERLAVGSEVEWGIRPDDGSEFAWARFRVVDGAAADARCREIDATLGERTPLVAAQLKAQVYVDAGRYAAAMDLLAPLLRETDLPVGWILLDRALTALDLRDTPLGVRTQHEMRTLRETDRGP